MDLYSIIFIVGLVASILFGYLLGFGKAFKFCTGGIVKHILALWVCITFGGMIASIPFVANLITKGNEFFGGYAELLARINLASWIYYVILFILVEVVRFIIAVIIKHLFEPKDKKTVVGGIRNIINRALGAILFGATWLFLTWAVLAVLSMLTDVGGVANWVETISTTKGARLINGLYQHNPIDFSVIFGLKK